MARENLLAVTRRTIVIVLIQVAIIAGLSACGQQPPSVNVTNTAAPTRVPLQSQELGGILLPFEDTFDNRLRPEWEVISGEPLFVDGHLKASGDDRLTLKIGDETFGGNFTVSFDTYECAGDLYITFGEKIRFHFYQHTNIRWEAFQDNEWVELEQINGYPCANTIQFKVEGNTYTVFGGGESLKQGAFGDTAYGPLTISAEYVREIDNLRITSP